MVPVTWHHFLRQKVSGVYPNIYRGAVWVTDLSSTGPKFFVSQSWDTPPYPVHRGGGDRTVQRRFGGRPPRVLGSSPLLTPGVRLTTCPYQTLSPVPLAHHGQSHLRFATTVFCPNPKMPNSAFEINAWGSEKTVHLGFLFTPACPGDVGGGGALLVGFPLGQTSREGTGQDRFGAAPETRGSSFCMWPTARP